MAKLVTVGTFTSPIDAHLAKGRLEAEGISAFVAHEHHIWANWVLSHALGGVKLQVVSENAAKAQAILKEHVEGKYEAALEEEFPDIKGNACPKCNSKEFKNAIPFGLLALVILTLGLISVIFPVRRENHTCLKCGNKWNH